MQDEPRSEGLEDHWQFQADFQQPVNSKNISPTQAAQNYRVFRVYYTKDILVLRIGNGHSSLADA